uniref:carbonic anhydrase n=2 Tax=Cuerna arida TaxID=1464854 RepID=A0A1B6ETW0_9HEMI
MHLIHYNSLYDSIETAQCRSDGLAIIAVLFCASLEDNVYFNPIISALENEYIYGSFGNMSTVPGPIDLLQLLPYESQRFFRYHGSLTTPPCSEIVTWTVMEHVSYISKNQLQRFCKVRTKTGGKTNFRWPKPLNNRKVYLLTGGQTQKSGNVAVIVYLSMLTMLFDCQLL